MAKALLQPGEKRTVRFALRCEDLAFLDGALASCLEPGTIEVFAGPSASADALLGAAVTLAA
jgi:hypothetical protein